MLDSSLTASVLLREVEYFKGVLIMTTNRVQAFDPAILSRIHHAVNFLEPSKEHEARVWQLWERASQGRGESSRAIKHWVEGLIKNIKRVPLSGREIRNVFMVAQALAEQDANSSGITESDLDRAYKYRNDFRKDTWSQRDQATRMHATPVGYNFR